MEEVGKTSGRNILEMVVRRFLSSKGGTIRNILERVACRFSSLKGGTR